MTTPASQQFEEYAREATKVITGLAGGGSEMFAGKIGDMYKADLIFCAGRVRDRHERMHTLWAGEAKKRKAAEGIIAEMTDALEECGEYFDNRADADFNTEDGFIPNEEMRLLSVVKEALAKAGRTA